MYYTFFPPKGFNQMQSVTLNCFESISNIHLNVNFNPKKMMLSLSSLSGKSVTATNFYLVIFHCLLFSILYLFNNHILFEVKIMEPTCR